ncbi:MAG: UDP-N-acetylglucosamine 4,6-dehydratase, partial [Treponemataceae bacterium]|nr:UDP-N-acetylglucosamine 4,6-dehydratase [Treponemataceae bacterium]
KYPVYFFKSDTTGEKDFEEFFTDKETLDMSRFANLGVIKNEPVFEPKKLAMFVARIKAMRTKGGWTRGELIDLFNEMIPNFNHKETGKFLDGRM